MKEKYIVEDEDGIVVYDETDDHAEDDYAVVDDSSESHIAVDPNPIVNGIRMTGFIKDHDGYRLKTNEEIFTDEYMQEFDRYITEKKAKQKRTDRTVSILVILF